METFDGDNVIAKLMKIVNFVVVCVSIYIYTHTICQPLIDWVLGVFRKN